MIKRSLTLRTHFMGSLLLGALIAVCSFAPQLAYADEQAAKLKSSTNIAIRDKAGIAQDMPAANMQYIEPSAVGHAHMPSMGMSKGQAAQEVITSSYDSADTTYSTQNVYVDQSASAMPVQTETNDYLLGPEDRLKITVFGEKEMSKDYRVDSNGFISFPLIGDVMVKGLTASQTEDIIREKLKQGYLKKPSVSIELAESRPFYILGEVRRPGSYNYIPGMSVLKAVAISGGFTYRADREEIEVLRGHSAPKDPILLAPKDTVKPGDVIYVQERFF